MDIIRWILNILFSLYLFKFLIIGNQIIIKLFNQIDYQYNIETDYDIYSKITFKYKYNLNLLII